MTFFVAELDANAADKADADKRTPVPAEADREKAKKLVRELFKDEYAKKGTADRLALASKLLEQAPETNDDPAARFVLWAEAGELAAGAGDLTLALKAAEGVAKDFAVAPCEVKADAVEMVAKTASSQAALKALVDTALELVDEALATEDFESAIRLVKAGEGAARKAKLIALVSAVQGRTKQVELRAKEFEEFKLAMAALMKDDKDGEANLAAGKYLCLVKGNWEKGLPLLAIGKDPALKAIAATELTMPAAPADQVSLADKWWDIADADKSKTTKVQYQRRALHWYSLAAPELKGLTKTKVDKRITDLAAQGIKIGPVEPASTTIVFKDVKDIRELGETKKGATWTIKDGKPTGTPDSVFWFKQRLAPPYWVRIAATTGGEDQALAFAPEPVYDRGRFWMVNTPAKGSMNLRINHTRDLTQFVPLEAGKHVIEAQVTKDGVTVLIDGKEQQRYKFEKDVPSSGRFGIYSFTGGTGIESLTFGGKVLTGGRSQAVGGQEGGNAFESTGEKGALLGGIAYKTRFEDQNRPEIAYLQPLYLTTAGLKPAMGFGHQPDSKAHPNVEAKSGYAVGGLMVWSSEIAGFHLVRGVKVQFMRRKGQALDPKDFYWSPWIGLNGDNKQATMLGGDGKPIVGIHGRAGGAINSLGILQP